MVVGRLTREDEENQEVAELAQVFELQDVVAIRAVDQDSLLVNNVVLDAHFLHSLFSRLLPSV